MSEDARRIYRDWMCDGDRQLIDEAVTGGWWSVRRDIDNWVTPDGRLFIDGYSVADRPGEED